MKPNQGDIGEYLHKAYQNRMNPKEEAEEFLSGLRLPEEIKRWTGGPHRVTLTSLNLAFALVEFKEILGSCLTGSFHEELYQWQSKPKFKEQILRANEEKTLLATFEPTHDSSPNHNGLALTRLWIENPFKVFIRKTFLE